MVCSTLVSVSPLFLPKAGAGGSVRTEEELDHRLGYSAAEALYQVLIAVTHATDLAADFTIGFATFC